MICPECGKDLKGRICRDCQARRTRQGMLRHQRRFLQTWLAGQIDLRVKKLEGVLHLELFDDRWHSYCDTEMFQVSQRAYMRQLPPDLCPECLRVFQDLLAQAERT